MSSLHPFLIAGNWGYSRRTKPTLATEDGLNADSTPLVSGMGKFCILGISGRTWSEGLSVLSPSVSQCRNLNDVMILID